jgi:hypothetical protein
LLLIAGIANYSATEGQSIHVDQDMSTNFHTFTVRHWRTLVFLSDDSSTGKRSTSTGSSTAKSSGRS